MKIQVRIDAAGALRNQRFAFAHRDTLVLELLQNARRAGATNIELHFDAAARRLSVADDGCGIEDFQTLLTLHQSGWQAEPIREEHPFGVGFSSCLYAAERCIVRSKGRCIDFLTEAALALEPIEVQPDAASSGCPGCQVELHGVHLVELEQRIERLCEGFPVPIHFNGRALERRYAIDRLQAVPTPVGRVQLAGRYDGRHSRECLVYLQGICVLRPIWWDADRVNIVHLDAAQFLARLPDRVSLLDEDLQGPRIQAALGSAWREALVAAKARLSAERFVAAYFQVMRQWGHRDLLNDLDLLPAELCQAIVGYPHQQADGACDFLQALDRAPSRAAIEGGSCTLVNLGPLDEFNAARWMFALHRGHLVVDAVWLDPGHWAHRCIQDLESQEVELQAIDEHTRSSFEGRWLWAPVVLCDRLRIQLGDISTEVSSEGVGHDGTLYIPAGEASGRALRQLSRYLDENDLSLDHELGEDLQALADLLRRLRSTDPVQTFDSLLAELRLGQYPLLRGRSFRVSIGIGNGNGNGDQPGHSVECDPVIDAPTEFSGDSHAAH